MEEYEKIEYWIGISEYDLETAQALLDTKRFLYVGFMCHQAIEKILKAAYIKSNKSIPPYSHSLIDISSKADIFNNLSSDQKDLLDLLQPLNIQARYPTYKEMLLKSLSYDKCKDILYKTKELHKWIKMKLLGS